MKGIVIALVISAGTMLTTLSPEYALARQAAPTLGAMTLKPSDCGHIGKYPGCEKITPQGKLIIHFSPALIEAIKKSR
jgi:hypothetical protein